MPYTSKDLAATAYPVRYETVLNRLSGTANYRAKGKATSSRLAFIVCHEDLAMINGDPPDAPQNRAWCILVTSLSLPI